MVQQNTNSASVLYTLQLNKVELGLFGGKETSLGGEMTGNPLNKCPSPPPILWMSNEATKDVKFLLSVVNS